MIRPTFEKTNCYDFINGHYWENVIYWQCKYCGENEQPKCHKCVREDGKIVTDELSQQPNKALI